MVVTMTLIEIAEDKLFEAIKECQDAAMTPRQFVTTSANLWDIALGQRKSDEQKEWSRMLGKIRMV